MKTPDQVTFEELARSAQTASLKADAEARKAGIKVMGLVRASQKVKSSKFSARKKLKSA